MNIALVGPELEENLALRYLHASLSKAGHTCRIFDFHASGQIDTLASSIIAFNPGMIGLSMVFTARAREYIALSESVRKLGFTGHITAGGHFASFHAEQLLLSYNSLDTIIHGEGETFLVDLAENIDKPQLVNNISYRGTDGAICRTAQWANRPELDTLPWPTRTPPMHTYLGMPIANMLGSRGCFGNCDFCSIAAWHRENGGLRFRFREPVEVAKEMAYLYHDLGARIFNFHDDNFFHPLERESINRFQTIAKYLKNEKVGKIAVQVKARPDSISQPIVSALKKIGLFRVFLGVESNAVAGLKALGRGITRECNYKALDILKRNGIHTTFNLLMFEPEMTPGDFMDNVNMLTMYPSFPLNFGRVEVYSGTPLEVRLRGENRLIGGYFGYTYSIKDPSMQTAFELFRKIFTGRNFDVDGMNMLSMRLDYYYHLMQHFYPQLLTPDLTAETKGMIADLNRNSAILLKSIHDFVIEGGDHIPADVNNTVKGLLAWRETYDNIARPKFLNQIKKIEESVSQSCTSKSGTIPTLAAATAAAVLVIASLNCDNPVRNDWHVSEMIADPLDSTELDWANAILLPQDQAEMISYQIQSNYQSELRSLTQRYNYNGKLLNVELMIDTIGAASAWRISVPQTPDSASFTKELGELISGWNFMGNIGRGKCVLNISVTNYPYPPSSIQNDTMAWHIFEIIGMPPDTTPAKPVQVSILDTVWNNSLWDTFYAFDTNAVSAIKNEINSVYFSSLNAKVQQILVTNTLDLEIDMILDVFGKVTMFRVRHPKEETIDSTMNSEFVNTIALWKFSFIKTTVAKSGKCTIDLKFIKFSTHFSEMMPNPGLMPITPLE